MSHMERIELDDQEWAVLPGSPVRLAVGDVLRCALRHGGAPLASAVPDDVWAISRRGGARWRERDPSIEAVGEVLDQAFDLAERCIPVVRLRRPQNVGAGRHDDLAVQYRDSITDLRRLLLEECHGNVSELARRTGLPRRTLHRRLKDMAAILPPKLATVPALPEVERKAG